MQIERGVVRLGAEIEVADWKNGASFSSVAKKLLKAGYMIGNEETWEEWHTYHCDCLAGGCGIVRRGDLVDPPLVSMTYDATLPKEGAEYIMSPILVADQGMPHFERIWNTITSDANWTNELIDQKGRPCSPSVHLHVSATLENRVSRDQEFQQEILHALGLFAPEFFALADTADYRRGLAYRLPDRHSMKTIPGGAHHGFIQVRNATRNKFVWIEWRLFEAAYANWPYVERAAYLTAGLTRGLLEDLVFSQLMSTGYAQPFDSKQLTKAVSNDDPHLVLEQVNPQRMEALREIVVGHLDDDDYARAVVTSMFDEVGI
jgi:hypothetical protein